MTVRAIIVDDEEPARELMRSFLAQYSDVDIVGEAGDGATAVSLTKRVTPDVVFLDVQMPTMSGFDVLAALGADNAPVVVFVTAYDDYALRAFEVSACDYLLKPFDADRFANTMRRVLGRVHDLSLRASGQSAIRAVLEHVRSVQDRVVVKSDGRHLFLDAGEIEWLEVVGKETRVHVGTSVVAVRESLNTLVERLDPGRFVRVHRSAVVNRSHIREMQPWFKGDYVLIMRSGARVVSGRTYRDQVRRLIEAR